MLVEGVPGLAKTLAVKTLARGAAHRLHSASSSRPTCCPPTSSARRSSIRAAASSLARKGPIFTNLLLADEINRAPAKVQSALLEAMQERQVTLGDTTYPLPEPFLVFATQNPIEQEGTYPLPEAQVDRFLLKVRSTTPAAPRSEAISTACWASARPTCARCSTASAVLRLRRVVDGVYIDARIRDYMVALVAATRDPRAVGLATSADLIAFGASPRATLYLARAARRSRSCAAAAT